MKRIKQYRGYTIWKNGFNFVVEQPTGFFFEEESANIATAKKWIDIALAELQCPQPK